MTNTSLAIIIAIPVWACICLVALALVRGGARCDRRDELEREIRRMRQMEIGQ
jgi:hypothetical protein